MRYGGGYPLNGANPLSSILRPPWLFTRKVTFLLNAPCPDLWIWLCVCLLSPACIVLCGWSPSLSFLSPSLRACLFACCSRICFCVFPTLCPLVGTLCQSLAAAAPSAIVLLFRQSFVSSPIPTYPASPLHCIPAWSRKSSLENSNSAVAQIHLGVLTLLWMLKQIVCPSTCNQGARVAKGEPEPCHPLLTQTHCQGLLGLIGWRQQWGPTLKENRSSEIYLNPLKILTKWQGNLWGNLTLLKKYAYNHALHDDYSLSAWIKIFCLYAFAFKH